MHELLCPLNGHGGLLLAGGRKDSIKQFLSSLSASLDLGEALAQIVGLPILQFILSAARLQQDDMQLVAQIVHSLSNVR